MFHGGCEKWLQATFSSNGFNKGSSSCWTTCSTSYIVLQFRRYFIHPHFVVYSKNKKPIAYNIISTYCCVFHYFSVELKCTAFHGFPKIPNLLPYFFNHREYKNKYNILTKCKWIETILMYFKLLNVQWK